MIPEVLKAGLRVMLPSGNIVQLVRLEGDEWTCTYTMMARARGEVIYSVKFLCRFGALV